MDPFIEHRELDTPLGPVLFRPLRPGDEEELLRFFQERMSSRSQYLFCPHDPAYPERCLGEFSDRIRRHRQQRDLTLVVDQDGAVVGYFFLWGLDRPNRPPTLGIGLADALHGHGIGGAMMDYLLEAARALQLPAIELTHESTNARAAHLYLGRGFVYTGEERRHGPPGSRVERVMRWER